MQLTEAEVDALRDYLLAGGFLFIDDFWGSWAWGSFVEQMQRVFPDREIVEIPITHPLFDVVFDVEEMFKAKHEHGRIHSDVGQCGMRVGTVPIGGLQVQCILPELIPNPRRDRNERGAMRTEHEVVWIG